MAYPDSFLRFVAIGSLYGNETFSYSISFTRNESGRPAAPDEVPQGVIDATVAFHQSTIGTGTGAVLQTIKLNEIGTNGRYVSSGDTVRHDFDPPVAGVGGANMPPQSALAITLRTDAQRGRAARGRFYVPTLARAVSQDGRITVAQATDAVAVSTTFLNALNAALPGWSAAVVSDIGAGTFREVKYLEVGRVLDTIRSRRTSLDEDRQTGADLTGWTGGGGPF